MLWSCAYKILKNKSLLVLYIAYRNYDIRKFKLLAHYNKIFQMLQNPLFKYWRKWVFMHPLSIFMKFRQFSYYFWFIACDFHLKPYLASHEPLSNPIAHPNNVSSRLIYIRKANDYWFSCSYAIHYPSEEQSSGTIM